MADDVVLNKKLEVFHYTSAGGDLYRLVGGDDLGNAYILTREKVVDFIADWMEFGFPEYSWTQKTGSGDVFPGPDWQSVEERLTALESPPGGPLPDRVTTMAKRLAVVEDRLKALEDLDDEVVEIGDSIKKLVERVEKLEKPGGLGRLGGRVENLERTLDSFHRALAGHS